MRSYIDKRTDPAKSTYGWRKPNKVVRLTVMTSNYDQSFTSQPITTMQTYYYQFNMRVS